MSVITNIEDSKNTSTNTNNNFFESLIDNNIFVISKSFEQTIPDILSYLHNKSNLATHKIEIVKYLQMLFLKININSEIFLRKKSSDKDQLNLFQIIIHEYISYTNISNNLDDEYSYRNELSELFNILLIQVTFDRESYHYILSFLLKYINQKNNTLKIKENEEEHNENEFHLTSEHIKRILFLLYKFYGCIDENRLSSNYFFFSGESNSSITIPMKNSIKDDKKLISADENLSILMFLKVFPPVYIKAIHKNSDFNILELILDEKDKTQNIFINIDIYNNLKSNFSPDIIGTLSESETNWLLIKYKRKKAKLKVYLNGNKIYSGKNKEKDKEEIKQIVLFSNFIGICYNFIIFKTKRKEILPKFLENQMKNNHIGSLSSIDNDNNNKINTPNKRTLFYNGFVDEELLFPFIKNELKDELGPETLNNLFNINDNGNDINLNNYINSISNNDIKDFMEKIIAIYMPSRAVIPESCKKYTLLDTPKLIIEDSMNGLDAYFITKNPSLNGVHFYKRIVNNFISIGGLNNLLPIIEIMTEHSEFLTKENFGYFFDILIYIFTPQYEKALSKEKNNNFFLYLSYFLSNIPENLYDNNLIGRFRAISSFLMNQINHNDDFWQFFHQFHNYILMNEKILFKFNYEERKEIIEIIKQSFANIKPDQKLFIIDVNKIIKIILYLDENKNKLFCCKAHSQYFIEKYETMVPELSIRLLPFEELLLYLFKEFKRKVDFNINNDTDNNNEIEEMGANLYKIFELLTYDISPCVQKMIIRLFSSFLDNNFNEYFKYIDKEQQILNIFLFIFKTSVFEIKKDLLELIFVILKNEKNSDISLGKKELIFIFITNNILPFYLFEDKDLLQITTKQEEGENLGMEFNLQKIASQEIVYKENIDFFNANEIENIRNDNPMKHSLKITNTSIIDNYLDESGDLMNEMYGEDDLLKKIKTETNINGVNYSLPMLDKNMVKIYSIYDKSNIKILIKDLFDLICKVFNEGVMIELCLSLLTKIVSKGDILLISSFLKFLNNEINNNSSNESKAKIHEIYNNQDLFQWLVETYFQAKLIKKSNCDKTIFVPGFNLNNEKNENFDEQAKNNAIEEIIKMCKQIILKIFDENIYKMDYILTLSKYYYELRNDINNFSFVRKKTFKFLEEIGCKVISSCNKPDIMNNLQQKKTVYFFNLLFEFVTFNKLKQKDLEAHAKEGSLYQVLSEKLKHILISKKDNERESSGFNIQEEISSKFKEYHLFKSAFDNLTPLWNEQKWENDDLYNDYISHKKNVNINELELLFYNFSDIDELRDEINKKKIYVNKGIPLIYILYHFFILIFSIGGTESELRALFIHFRLFIISLIVSSSTLSSSNAKKKRWPSDEQYKNVQQTTEAILFNFLLFLYIKIKDINEKISYFNDLEKKEQHLEDSDKNYLNYLYQIYKLLMENMGYFLKTLNKIYREIKKEEENKNQGLKSFGSLLKGVKHFFVEYEGVKKSGGFKLMEKMYSECHSLSAYNINYLDQITTLDFNKKEFLINSLSIDTNKDKEKNESFLELEKYVLPFIEDYQIEDFFNRHSKEYEQLLLPFITYISSRRDAVQNIIPLYDNRPNITSYPKELCLIPDYLPQDLYDSNILSLNIKASNKSLYNYLQINELKFQTEEHNIIHNYKKEKEKLFSFTGIWSNKDYFYNKKKYRLKYRLLNHLSDDYTRVLLTPIIDVDYYLPEFSKFDPSNLFRNTVEYNPICKVVDLSVDLKLLKSPEKNEKKGDNNKKENETIGTTINNSNSNKIIETPIETPSEEKNGNEENNNEDEDKNALYYIGNKYYDFIIKEISEENRNHLFKEFIKKKYDTSEFIIDACLVRLAFHIRGKIFTNKNGIGFISFDSKRKGNEEDYDSDRKVCFGSVFRTQSKFKHYYIFIPYDTIQFVFKRRYYFKKTALEIFTENRKSYLFRIDEKIELFIEEIKNELNEHKKDIEDILIEYTKFDEKIGFINKKNIFLNTNLQILTKKKKYMNLYTLYEKWKTWQISTLKMIMIMNLYSNRSYNDINQYPVFPWIITDYTSATLPPYKDKNFIRSMNKPMGMMDYTDEAKERKENYEEHWRSGEADADREDNYDRYGSHYSTSLYLTYYLVRVFPYSYIRIELQGKSFDDPNRLFNSLSDSFKCALTQKSDLRELIPEFYCFPEMFSNMNELNLGEITDAKGMPKLVKGVEIPEWANRNEYYFIAKHRELLESVEINETINEWFNIIFGSKQKGKEAKKIGNLFLKQTYEDFEDTYKKSSNKEQIYQCRMVEFGVTPNQLFKYDAHKRYNLNDFGKIKRSLLYNILQNKDKDKKKENNEKEKEKEKEKEFDLQEIKINIEEKIYKMFIFVVKKKDKKKERIYLLANNKVKVYKKKDKSQFFSTKTKGKDKSKDKIEKEMNETETTLNNSLEDIEEKIDNENDNPYLSSSYTVAERQRENDFKNPEIEHSKISINSKYDKKFTLPRYRMKFNESPTILYEGGYYIAFGGFWNGDIIIKQLKDDNNKTDKKKNKSMKINIIKTCEFSPITKIIIDKTETIVICYNSEGTVFVYIIDQNEKLIWHLHKIINEGQGEISSLALNENLNIFIICYKNCYCMVYTLPDCKLFNSFIIEENDLNSNTSVSRDNNEINIGKENNTTPISSSNKVYSPDITIISQSPLPCFIFYIKKRKSLCIYSINAHFIKELILGYDIVENGIKKYTDFLFRDYLFIYNIKNGTLDIHRLIDLDIVASSPLITGQFVDFLFTKENCHAFILVKVKQENEEKYPIYKMLLLKQAPHDTGKNQLFN